MTHVKDESPVTSEMLEKLLDQLAEAASWQGMQYQIGYRAGDPQADDDVKAVTEAKAAVIAALSVPLRPDETERGEVALPLDDLIRPLDGIDMQQPGFHHRKGWNDAIMHCMDLQRAIAASPTSDGVVTDEQVQAVGALYGNYIPGHGWTGFGPRPEDILKALQPSGSVK